jgi:hypothetical protein
MAAVARIGAVVAFAALLGVKVSAAQQQTTPSDPHHLDNNSNQSGSSITEQQQQKNTTTLSGQAMMMNQTFTTSWISLVSEVKVTGISAIDTEHIAINLRYDGEGAPPGVSVVAITNSSSGTIIGSMMQQDSIMMGQQEEMMMMRGMIMASNQQSNLSADQESEQQHHHRRQQMQSSNSATNNSMQILSMQSGSNYLEAGWQGQESNSATVLVQLDGDIPEEGHIMVMVFPFLHR